MLRPRSSAALALLVGTLACNSNTHRPTGDPPRPAPTTPSSAPPNAATTTAGPDAAQTQGKFRRVYLDAVDWRSGGVVMLLRADGSGVIRKAGKLHDNSVPEKRYELRADPKRMAAFEAILGKHDALTMSVKSFQAPGDSLTTLSLTPQEGDEVVLEGALGRNDAYRALCGELVEAIENIDLANAKITYEGEFDREWKAPE